MALLFISATSCKKFLDTKPEDFAVPEEYYVTESQLNDALAGVYTSLTSNGTFGLYLNAFMEHGNDEGFYKSTTTTLNAMAYDHTAADTYVEAAWRDLYIGINRANYLLANINKAPMDEKKRGAIKGEALFLRSFMYYQLVINWGDVPLLITPTVNSNDVNKPRTPAKQVYEQITKDLKEAHDLVNTYAVNGNPVHISRTAVQAMLARVYLKMAGEPLKEVARYADAKAWADSAIQSGVHSLNPSFPQIFINQSADLYDNTTKEVLWEIEFYGNNVGALRAGGRFVNYLAVTNNNVAAGVGYGRVGVTGYMYRLYSPGDLRRDWTIAPYAFAGNNGTEEVLKASTDIYSRWPGKWRRKYETVLPRNTDYGPTNFPVIRYSDVLLMYAEAENALNGPTTFAYNAINQVRRRGFGFAANLPVASVSVVNNITLATAGNTGYLATVLIIPVTITGGGGSGATANATVSASTRKVTSVNILTPGNGYTSAPTITIGRQWSANTFYEANTQVFHLNNNYTITTAGTSTATPPTNTSGASSAAVTGAVFTYAGLRATATATVGTYNVDITTGLSAALFQQEIMDERARELTYEGVRKADLIRWGKFIDQMKLMEADINLNAPANLKYSTRGYRNVSEKHLLLPIPSAELSLNNAMVQNPLWR